MIITFFGPNFPVTQSIWTAEFSKFRTLCWLIERELQDWIIASERGRKNVEQNGIYMKFSWKREQEEHDENGDGDGDGEIVLTPKETQSFKEPLIWMT